ncbi:hypothetical protein SNE40_012073 [Patella caerulea]|uniref:Uncharacterized protein n=1 Tax=Patella caerulea TaxID=87958 RepID=A0AAN8JP26_PATCE
MERDKLVHPIRPPCKYSCKKGCTKVFGSDDRNQIHKQFWSMNFYDRRKWVWNNVQQSNIKRVTTAERATSRRRFTYSYRFRRAEESGGGLHDVCKLIFSLGYDQKSDSAIMRCLQSAPSASLNPNSDQEINMFLTIN